MEPVELLLLYWFQSTHNYDLKDLDGSYSTSVGFTREGSTCLYNLGAHFLFIPVYKNILASHLAQPNDV